MKKIVYLNVVFTQNYMITNDGHVFNADRNRFLKCSVDKDGYIEYMLYTTTGVRHFRASRILMSTYAPVDGYESLVVNHLDGDIKNNTIENLEWCTVRENTIHAYKTGLAHGLKGSKNSQAKLSDEDVINIIKLKKDKNITNIELAKMFNVSPSLISMIMHGKIWSHLTKDIIF